MTGQVAGQQDPGPGGLATVGVRDSQLDRDGATISYSVCTAANSPAVAGTAANGPGVGGPGAGGTAASGPAADGGTAAHGLAASGPAAGDPAVGDPAVGDPAVDRLAVSSPAVGGTAIHGPAAAGTAASGPAAGDPAVGGTAASGPATGGPAPLLLTHGYGASAAMWQANLAALSAGRTVITWDICGHGRTSSPADPARYSEAGSVADMAAVLDACGTQRAVVGGLSLGGYLSLAFWLRHPDRVAALILCDTGPGFRRDEPRDQWNARALARADALERRGAEALSNSPEVPDTGQNLRGLALAARGILTQRDARVLESLPGITVPVLVVVGANDTPFRAAADYMASKIPGATLAVLDNAGHAANMDQPAAFNAAVLDFLSTLPSAASA